MIPSKFAARLLGAALALGSAQAQAVQPVAAIKPVTESYFGTAVTDPYRYMEDVATPEVQQWAKAQSEHTRALLDSIPGRAKLLARIAELEASVEARVASVKRLPNEVYFYEKRGAKDNQFKLYMRQGLKGQERLLLDPEALTQARGVPQAITFYQPSDSGKYVAYGLSEGGSEEASIHVLETATGKEMIKPIDRAHYSSARWMPDDSGFFYLRQRKLAKGAAQTEKYRFQTSYFHALNGRAADRAIVQAGVSKNIAITPEEFPNVFSVTETPYVVAIPGNGVQREFAAYIAARTDVLKPKVKWRKLFGVEDDVTDFAIHGDDLYLLTHKNASRFKLLRTSVSQPDIASAEVMIAPSQAVLVNMAVAKDGLYVQARDGTVGQLYRLAFGKQAVPELLQLPREGSLDINSSDPRLAGLVLTIGSWTHDFGIHVLDTVSNKFVDSGLQTVGAYGAPQGLNVKEVLVKSHDGVEVPLSIVYPGSIKLDSSNPMHLYGYGSYGMTDDPVYVPRFLAWYELGGIRATCHVRGGGAYGQDWHLAGKLATKPNTWKDLIACAEYLIKEGYTSSSKLAIHGGSAGGILVGRAMTERPDLFAAVVPEVGVLNALRGENSANGVPNIPEFGTVKDPQQFRYLLEMDAFHHVQDGVKYPATLLIHGINDQRVPAAESMKMAARLQAASSSGKPTLLRLDYAAGHGMGSTKTQRQEQYADLWSFMLWQFGDPRFQPTK